MKIIKTTVVANYYTLFVRLHLLFVANFTSLQLQLFIFASRFLPNPAKRNKTRPGLHFLFGFILILNGLGLVITFRRDRAILTHVDFGPNCVKNVVFCSFF